MTRGLMDRLLDVIEAATFERADEQFVSAALAMLALAISRLPPADREETLTAIEDGGALRRAVGMFPGACQTPEVSYGPFARH
jgi:hypothetical protein